MSVFAIEQCGAGAELVTAEEIRKGREGEPEWMEEAAQAIRGWKECDDE